MTKRTTVAGLATGAAVAAGGAAAVHTVRQARRERIAVGRRTLTGSLAHTADRETTVRTRDGVTLHVEVDEPDRPREGAPTVVLVHGFTVSSRAWVFQRRALTEAGYRVVSYDHRGHGRSGQSDVEHATIEQLGHDLRLVLDRVVEPIAPGGPIVLVGHSMGGMTLMAFGQDCAELIGPRIVGAAFMATSAGGEGRLISLGYGAAIGRLIERYGPGALQGLSRQEQVFRSLRRFGRDIEDYFVQHYSFASPVSQTLVRFTGDLAFETSFRTIGGFIATFNEHDRRDALEVWGRIPALVLTAADDRLTPSDHGRLIADSIPGAEHVLVTGAGHMVMLEHPDIVTKELLELLAEVGK
jgi:pimeloyl-ACP methyl ester carboxylesterase